MKASRLSHLTTNCRAYRQLSNAADLLLSGGYVNDNWKVIRFLENQVLYYGSDIALQKRYSIPYEDGAAISRPGFLTIYRYFLPTITQEVDNTTYGMAECAKPIVFPGGDGDIVFSDDTQLLYGLLVPKDVYVTSIELDSGDVLYNGVDFQARYGLINFNENPVQLFSGMKFMARTYTERKRNLYSYTLGIDDVYGPVDRIVEYYRRNQSPKAFYLACAQAIGMPVLREESTVLGVMPLHGGKAYMTTSGRYDAPFPHNWLRKGEVLPAGYVIGGEDLFQMFGPNDVLPAGLSGVDLRESCPVPGLVAPNREAQLFVDGHYRPYCEGKTSDLIAYWQYLENMPDPDGEKPATGNVMLYMLNVVLAGKYILVRVNEHVMPSSMQLRLQEFVQKQKPMGSVLIYAPIERRIQEIEESNGD